GGRIQASGGAQAERSVLTSRSGKSAQTVRKGRPGNRRAETGSEPGSQGSCSAQRDGHNPNIPQGLWCSGQGVYARIEHQSELGRGSRLTRLLLCAKRG